MVEVREENERLKMILTQITEDYQSLSDIVRREQAKKPIKNTAEDDEVEETISLRLGTSSSGQRKEDKMKIVTGKDGERFGGCLTLGLNMKFEGSDDSLKEPVLNLSSDNSSEELKEEDTGAEPWPPSKAAKSARTGDDEVSQQPLVKKARVSVRARCDGPTVCTPNYVIISSNMNHHHHLDCIHACMGFLGGYSMLIALVCNITITY